MLTRIFVCFCFIWGGIRAQSKLVPVVNGWSGNSVNTVVFRKNSLVTYKNLQFIAFYNPVGKLTLGKRNLESSKWEVL